MVKSYLGDGLYANLGPYPGAVTITAENGHVIQDKIVFDETTLPAFANFVQMHWGRKNDTE